MLSSVGDFVRYFEGVRRRAWATVDREDLEPGPPMNLAATRARLEGTHRAEMARLLSMSNERLSELVHDLEEGTVKVWRFLMALVEHEVHHRSQLDCWLAAAGVEPQQLYGYRMEDVVARVRARSQSETGEASSLGHVDLLSLHAIPRARTKGRNRPMAKNDEVKAGVPIARVFRARARPGKEKELAEKLRRHFLALKEVFGDSWRDSHLPPGYAELIEAHSIEHDELTDDLLKAGPFSLRSS